MRDSFCFWSIAAGRDAQLIRTLVSSARRVGVFKDFHLWTHRTVRGGICHDLPKRQAPRQLFHLEILQKEVSKLRYTYFVWLAPDTYFVRQPGNVLRVLQGAPVHATLESDAHSNKTIRSEWEDCSLTNYIRIMQFNGVRSRSIFNVDSGFWIVHRDAIDSFCELCWDFWEFCQRAGYVFSLEPVLAYATQMLCGNPYLHTLARTADLWAVDRAGCFSENLPDGQPWKFVHYFTGESLELNPAMVRLPHSHNALMERANRPSE